MKDRGQRDEEKTRKASESELHRREEVDDTALQLPPSPSHLSDEREWVEATKRIGTMLAGKWRLDQPLAVGGMGTVFASNHRRTEHEVVVKILNSALVKSEALVKRFRAEALVANKIKHDDVVHILDQDFDEDGVPFLVMERLAGQPVDRWLAQHKQTLGEGAAPEAVCWIAVELLGVLEAAHAEKIIHRDIKPSNLLVTESPRRRLRVLDFGIAKARELTGIVTQGDLLGTPGFMAPEQTRDIPEKITPLTDIWGVGATLFYLLTGRPVFKGKTWRETMFRTRDNKAPSVLDFLPGLSDTIAELVDTSLRHEPEGRWASAAEMRRFAESALLEEQSRQTGDAADALRGAILRVAHRKGTATPREMLARLSSTRDVRQLQDWLVALSLDISPPELFGD